MELDSATSLSGCPKPTGLAGAVFHCIGLVGKGDSVEALRVCVCAVDEVGCVARLIEGREVSVRSVDSVSIIMGSGVSVLEFSNCASSLSLLLYGGLLVE